MTHASDELIWHYTTLETLALILSSKSLLATEAGFQNDPGESIYADTILTEALTRAENEHTSVVRSIRSIASHLERGDQYTVNLDRLLARSRFLLCASRDGDSLYCWRTYAAIGQIGCAIGLDPSAPLVVKGDAVAKQYAWESVTYEDDELAKLADKIVSEVALDYQESGTLHDQPNFGVLIDGYAKLRGELIAKAKSRSYVDEKEARITVPSPPRAALVFGAGAAGPRPRIALRSAPEGGRYTSDDAQALPIREVRLAPSAPGRAEDSLRWLLCSNDYAVDGIPEFRTYVDQAGEEVSDYFLNRDRSVRISRSQHRFQDA